MTIESQIIRRQLRATPPAPRTSELDEARRDANGDPDCTMCRGAGYLVRDVPVTDPHFGRLMPCPCYSAKLQAARQAKFFANSNLQGMQGKTFAAFASMPGTEDARALAEAFAAAPSGWLLLSGRYGCGKTHLALAIANQALANGVQVLFQTAPDFLQALRATFDKDNPARMEQVLGAAQQVELLVLDDLGAEKSSEFSVSELFNLLNYRYNRSLPTVITSNLTLDQIEKVNPRLGSRLSDYAVCDVIEMTAADYRKLAPQQRAGRAQ